MDFLSFRICEQLALTLKNRVAQEFFTVLKYFLSSRIFEQLVLTLKTEFALKFFKPGVRPPPQTHASYAYVVQFLVHPVILLALPLRDCFPFFVRLLPFYLVCSFATVYFVYSFTPVYFVPTDLIRQEASIRHRPAANCL